MGLQLNWATFRSGRIRSGLHNMYGGNAYNDVLFVPDID